MTQAMTKETPAKVVSLLGVALACMMFLLAVSYSDASFQAVQNPIPNPFGPDKVMAMLDNTAAGYSNFVSVNLTQPLKAEFAFYSDNVNWIVDNSREPILSFLGLDNLAKASNLTPAGQVAGAYTPNITYQSSSWGINVDTLYSLLIK